MDRRTLTPFPDRAVRDIGLADLFVRNASTQLHGAQEALADRAAANHVLHTSAIAIELLLKSYLLRTATDDDWNRVNIGHDLEKAAAYAAMAGLEPPSGLHSVIAELHPHFMQGGFQRDPSRSWSSGLAARACETAWRLARTITAQTASQDCQGS